jgi:hypothetical protein
MFTDPFILTFIAGALLGICGTLGCLWCVALTRNCQEVDQ